MSKNRFEDNEWTAECAAQLGREVGKLHKNRGFSRFEMPKPCWVCGCLVGICTRDCRKRSAHRNHYFTLHWPLQTTTLPFSALRGGAWGKVTPLTSNPSPAGGEERHCK